MRLSETLKSIHKGEECPYTFLTLSHRARDLEVQTKTQSLEIKRLQSALNDKKRRLDAANAYLDQLKRISGATLD